MRDRANRSSMRVLADDVIARSFGVLETILVVLILVTLAASAAPVYVGYTRAARTIEGKLLAASLWTAVQTNAIAACGSAVVVAAGFASAGLDRTGATTPVRWSITSGALNTVKMDCATGAMMADGDIFTLAGAAKDIDVIRVKLTHASAESPPTRLLCSGDSGISFTAC